MFRSAAIARIQSSESCWVFRLRAKTTAPPTAIARSKTRPPMITMAPMVT